MDWALNIIIVLWSAVGFTVGWCAATRRANRRIDEVQKLIDELKKAVGL